MKKKLPKNITTFDDLGGFVFSTNSEFSFSQDEIITETPKNNKQYLEVHLDKKNRAGKITTLIKGFQGSEQDLKELAKKLKTLCGVGGSQKDGTILIQGNFRDKIMNFLIKENYNTKRIGG